MTSAGFIVPPCEVDRRRAIVDRAGEDRVLLVFVFFAMCNELGERVGRLSAGLLPTPSAHHTTTVVELIPHFIDRQLCRQRRGTRWRAGVINFRT
jgi:hypothetical protein